MAFATFTDVNFSRSGTTWDVALELDGGPSASNTLRVVTGRRRVGEEDMNPQNPIIASTLRMVVYDESRIVHDRIKDNDHDQIRVTVKKGGTIWHRGFLRDVNGGTTVRYSNPELRLVFNDGIERLRNEQWDEKGRETLLEMLHYILSTKAKTDLDTRVALAFQDTDADTSNGRSRALRHDFEHQGRGSFYEVLSQTLRLYNLQCFQYDGKWRVLQRSYRDSGQFYNYEEKSSGGSISTGSRDPTNSISDSDWYGKEDEEDVKRTYAKRQGTETTYTYIRDGWSNPDFTRSSGEVLRSGTFPVGWHLDDPSTYDGSNNRIIADAGSSDFAEQYWDTVVTDGASDDTFDLRVKGNVLVNDTNETSFIQVTVGRLIAHDPNEAETRYADFSGNWQSSPQDLKVSTQESDSGQVTRSFDKTQNYSAPSSTTFGPWIIELRLFTGSKDPDSDSNQEVEEVRYNIGELKNFQQNAPEDTRPGSGVRYYTSAVANRVTGDTSVGSCSPEISREEQTSVYGGIQFLDSGSNEWELLHRKSSMEHATRSLGLQHLERLRLEDRYAMNQSKTERLIGYQKRSTISLNDTVTYESSDWLPHFVEERINSDFRKIGLTELKNESVPTRIHDTEEQ